jgi:hypothetical protein
MWIVVDDTLADILSELKDLDEEKLQELQDKSPEHAHFFELVKIEKKFGEIKGLGSGNAPLFVDNFIKLCDLNQHDLMLNKLMDIAERSRTVIDRNRGIPAKDEIFLGVVVDKLIKNDQIDKVVKLINHINPEHPYASKCVVKIVLQRPAEALKYYEKIGAKKDPITIRKAVDALTQNGFSNHEEIDLAVRSADSGVGMIKRISSKVLETGIKNNNLDDINKAISVAEQLEKDGNPLSCSEQLKVIYEALLNAGMNSEAREAADKIPVPEKRELALKAIEEHKA